MGREKQHPFLGPQGVNSERSDQRVGTEGVTFHPAGGDLFLKLLCVLSGGGRKKKPTTSSIFIFFTNL